VIYAAEVDVPVVFFSPFILLAVVVLAVGTLCVFLFVRRSRD
jgi:hypothetical protein